MLNLLFIKLADLFINFLLRTLKFFQHDSTISRMQRKKYLFRDELIENATVIGFFSKRNLTRKSIRILLETIRDYHELQHVQTG